MPFKKNPPPRGSVAVKTPPRGWLRSGVRVSASFQIFSSARRGGGICEGEYLQRVISWIMTRVSVKLMTMVAVGASSLLADSQHKSVGLD